MDRTQSREFHHHLARAIMHLNCLAGFLPFFEPAIEWIQPWNLSHGPGVQILPRGTFTRLFLFLPLPPRPQWHLMVAFPPI